MIKSITPFLDALKMKKFLSVAAKQLPAGKLYSLFVIAILFCGFTGSFNPLVGAETSKATSGKAEKPNVLFILADDLGWKDLSGEGSTFYESPNIDSIASDGIKFTQGYATCQVCSPSRASIMTGKYPARLAITDWIGAAEGTGWKRNTRLLPATYNHHLPHEDTTLAEAFREGGYRTFFAGKWHLGSEGSLPTDHGFDVNQGGHHRGSPPGGYFTPYKNPQMTDGPHGESLPIRLAEETCKFIEAESDQPFFAYLSFYSVHGPLQTTQELWSKYRKKASQQTDPGSRFIIDRTSPVRQVQDNPVYAGMVESMDTAVGKVLDTLDRLNLADNTIVVFTSDNGGVSAGDGKATSNLPLRGGKGRQWEGGIREPYYVKWPGEVAPGTTNDTPVTGTDFYPTLLEIAGLPSRPEQHVDGVSLVPLCKGASIQPRPIFWHYPHYGNQGGEPSTIIRDGDWKLINYHEDGRNELYNIKTAPRELDDLAAENPEIVARLSEQLKAWQKETNARFPVTNPNFSQSGHIRERENTLNKVLPGLEKSHAAILQPDWVGPGNWWQGKKN